MRPSLQIGIIGIGFGQQVLVPAFRSDPRCQVTAICASTMSRAEEVAQRLAIPRAWGCWQDMIGDPAVDAVAIATPAALQSEIASAALSAGKAIFCEKPVAASLHEALQLKKIAQQTSLPLMVDFEFPEISAWKQARQALHENIGQLRHIQVIWNVETYTSRMNLKSWKSDAESGGTLNSFISHTFHYLEWLFKPIIWLSANLMANPGAAGDGDTLDAISGQFKSGAGFSITASSNAFLGAGHRITAHGSDGTLVLTNPTKDYIQGFELSLGTRSSNHLVRMDVEDEMHHADGRVIAVSRIVTRFVDWILDGIPSHPGIDEAVRVQALLDAARKSNSNHGCRVDVPSSSATH
jgi:predicted dehydrogenase